MSRRPPKMIGPRPVTRPVKRVVKKSEDAPEGQKASSPAASKPASPEPKAAAEPAKESPASKSAADQPKPAVEQPKAAVEQPKPAAEQPKAAVEQPKPVAEQPKAATQQAKPAEQPKAAEQPKSVQPSKAESTSAKSSSSSKTQNRPAAKKEKQSKSSSSSRILLVLVILLLLGGNGYLIFDKFNTEEALATVTTNAKEAKITYANDIERKVAEISMLQDSIRGVIAEKEALGLALTEERARVAELEKLKGQVRSKQVSINALNSKLNRYKEDYETVKTNVGNLVAENQRLVTLKREMEEKMKAKEDSIKALAEVQVKLASKVSKAAALTAENVEIVVYNTGGKEMRNPKAMMAGKVKASMVLGKNDIAEHGAKDVFMRVVEPSGNTLSMGANSFDGVDGKKVYYTLKQTINFDNSGQKVTFIYNKGSRYIPGRYTIEFYSDGRKIGDSYFTLKR